MDRTWMKLNSYYDIISRWSQLKFALFSPQKLEEMIDFDVHIFQMGWFNHQLVIYIPQIPVVFKELSKNSAFMEAVPLRRRPLG